jgi:Helix-turn-helix domain
MRAALSERDMGAVIRIFRKWTGASQTDISVLTGVPQPDVSDLERGARHVTAMELFERFADGLGIPRPLLGLAERQPDTSPQRVATEAAPKVRSVHFIEWIAEHSNLSVREAHDRLAIRIGEIQNLPESVRHQRAYTRGRLTRDQLVAALERYYAASSHEDHGLYKARVGGHALVTSVLTKPGWLQARVSLGTPAEHFQYIPPTAAPILTPLLEGELLDAAIDRLAQAELSTTVLVNNPIYQLLRVAIQPGRLRATVTLVDFATYALTMDLLEAELVDALADLSGHLAATTTRDRRLRLPLRDARLPSVSHALDFQRRICAGGPVALLAAARPRGLAGRRPADYALLVQERSPRVLNVVGRLAVIPKAFHGPMVEPSAEADLYSSVQRELEEELLGRDELGNVFDEGLRKVDPFHTDLLSEPLRWLLDHQDPSAYRLECVGFGVNLLTGNYEFPCLIVINDEEWWARFGGQIEANWEIRQVRLHSSRDAGGLQDLILDPRWSNEGLFAFLEGLRRLAELDTAARVTVPEIDAEA